MTIRSVDDLIDTLRQTPLLPAERLDELAMNLRAGFFEPADLAEDLVHRGWLTVYQAKQIFLGHAADLVLGQYALLDLIGEGGMGQVFRARHRWLDRVEALKIIHPTHLANPKVLRRFQQEAQAAARLHHPNVVTIYDAEQAGDRFFIAMEYVDGPSLSRLVKDSGPMPPSLACECIRQVALGLQHAHEMGLVHRDVKPSNVLVTGVRGPTADGTPAGRGAGNGLLRPDRPALTVKLLDLGLAIVRQPGVAAGEEPRPGVTMGTPDYMAPEQARDAAGVDTRADVYSLGCTLYYLLTGRPPFPGGSAVQKLLSHQQVDPEPLEKLRPALPARVVAVVRRMMAKQPDDRFQTPGDVAAVLGEVYGTEKPRAAPDD